MTLLARLRLTFMIGLLSAGALVWLVSSMSPVNAPEWLLASVFGSMFLTLAGFLTFFGFRLRLKFDRGEYPDKIWRTAARQGMLLATAATLALSLSASHVGTPLNFLFLLALVISIEIASHRRRLEGYADGD